jgi:hypothetical protein
MRPPTPTSYAKATEVKGLRRAGIVEWEKQTEEMGDGGKFQISDCRLEAFPLPR